MGLYKTNKTKFLNFFAETGKTSINRILAFNKDESQFYTDLETIQERYKFGPNNIFNVDEIGISTVQASSQRPKTSWN
jgi:hypothetical protein